MEVNQNELNTREHFKEEVFKERLKKREIWINGDIDNLLIEKLYVNLLEMNDQSPDKILVMINSWGGDMYEGVVATDIMKTVSAPIVTIALAKAVSAGFIIFMGGDSRIIHSNTCLMMHPPALWGCGKVPNIQNHIDQINKTTDKLAVFFAKQTNGKTTIDYWKKLMNEEKDVYFSSEEALKLGLAHKVIGEDEHRDNRYLWKV
jgi:ATP-dependent Clp protease protease subunit